jgi:hypothetical protein
MASVATIIQVLTGPSVFGVLERVLTAAPGPYMVKVVKVANADIVVAAFPHGGYLTCIKSVPSLKNDNALTGRNKTNV